MLVAAGWWLPVRPAGCPLIYWWTAMNDPLNGGRTPAPKPPTGGLHTVGHKHPNSREKAASGSRAPNPAAEVDRVTGKA